MSVTNQPGQHPRPETLVNVPKLLTAYYALHPDAAVAAERVSFGTSGHRGSSFATSFNEDHIAAITQAICEYRTQQGQKRRGRCFWRRIRMR